MSVAFNFLRGYKDNLPVDSLVDGSIYLTMDEPALYAAVPTGAGGELELKRIGDYIMVAKVADLPASGANTSALYYCELENVLARYDGSQWVQINKQPTAEEMKVLLGLGSAAYKNVNAFDAAGAAAAVLGTEADGADAKTVYGAHAAAAAAKAAADAAQTQADKGVADAATAQAAAEAAQAQADKGVADAATAQAAAEAAQETANKGVADAAAAKAKAEEVLGTADDEATANTVYGAKAAAAAAQATANTAKAATETNAQDIADLKAAVGEGGSVAEKIKAAVEALDVEDTAVAGQYVSEVSETDGKIAVKRAALPVYNLVKAADAGEFAAVYNLTIDGVPTGATINIDKDKVVKSGSVVTNPEGQPAGTYLKIEFQNQDTPVYVDVAKLIEYVTAGDDTATIHVMVSDDHKVTANIIAGSVGATELSTEVNAKLNQAHTHANATVLDGITGEKVAAWDKAVTDAAKGIADAAAAQAKAEEVLGTAGDAATANTVYGAKAAAAAAQAQADKGVADAATAQAKAEEVLGTADDEATANTVYGAKAAAAAAQTQADKGVADAATAKAAADAAQGDVNNLKTYVGTFTPVGSETTVVGYVDAKVAASISSAMVWGEF